MTPPAVYSNSMHEKKRNTMKRTAPILYAAALLMLLVLPAHARVKPGLLYPSEWKSDTIADGVVYHNFEQYDGISQARQIVNVLEVFPDSPYKLRFIKTQEPDSLSGEIARYRSAGEDIIGGINAAYELAAVYVRIGGRNVSEVSLPPGHLRFWKHEGAVMKFPDGRVKLKFPSRTDGMKAIRYYRRSKATDILASAPMLIANYKLVGLTFLAPQYRGWTISQLETLDYENKNRHQGVRHPRTIVALTGSRHLLLITIDGRRAGISEGMSAAEATRFLERHFHPRYALNMDGGGSTTMCVKGHGQHATEVVNYPTDNKRYDHWGQRIVSTYLLLGRK